MAKDNRTDLQKMLDKLDATIAIERDRADDLQILATAAAVRRARAQSAAEAEMFERGETLSRALRTFAVKVAVADRAADMGRALTGAKVEPAPGTVNPPSVDAPKGKGKGTKIAESV